MSLNLIYKLYSVFNSSFENKNYVFFHIFLHCIIVILCMLVKNFNFNSFFLHLLSCLTGEKVLPLSKFCLFLHVLSVEDKIYFLAFSVIGMILQVLNIFGIKAFGDPYLRWRWDTFLLFFY